MAKTIPLTQGQAAIVDDDIYESLSRFNWYAYFDRKTYYARRHSPITGKIIQMHREIMGASDGTIIDHLNGNGLDNRRENLRFCTQSENQRNRGADVDNTSGYKGVTWHKVKKKWMAQIKVNKKNTYLGLYSDPAEAARAYDAAAIELHGEFACLNFQ